MTPASQRSIFSDAYRPLILQALLVQVLLSVVCMLMLDGGRLALCCAVAIGAFWPGAVSLLWRRPSGPDRLTRIYFQAAFPALLAAAAALA